MPSVSVVARGPLEIAFARMDGPIFAQVYLTEDGATARQITDLDPAVHGSSAQAIAWSPDGERLAFAFGPSITAGWGILDPDGGEPLIMSGIGSFAWSPDGSRVATGAAFDVLPAEAMNALAVSLADPDTGATEQIGQGILVGWHPDGERVVVMRTIGASETSPGGPQLVLISTTDGSEEELIRGARTARWSPDGLRTAYVVQESGCSTSPCDRILVAEEGSVEMTEVAVGYEPVWSPDGRWLAYVSEAADGTRLGVVDVETLESVDLGPVGYPPTWSPDARQLAVSYQSPEGGESMVQILDINSGQLVAEFPGFAPAWRPDAP
jgi:Tol biopolymer transport system component